MHMPDKCIIRRHPCAVPYHDSSPVYKLKCRLESDRPEVLFDEEAIIMHSIACLHGDQMYSAANFTSSLQWLQLGHSMS